VLPRAAPGTWDAGRVWSPTAVVGPDGIRRLWYAGQAPGSDVWSLGVATSADGGLSFARAAPGSILAPGAPSDFDGGSVLNPTVIYDDALGLYRMWYEGRDFFGKVAIGYAVSTDGVAWSKYPGNPVITADQLGLTSIGGPAVRRAPDGRLLMFIHGTSVAEPRRRIFALVNDGSLVATPAP
jgi:hypothetical protein